MFHLRSLYPTPSERKKLSRVSPGEARVTVVCDDPFTRGTNNSDRDFAIQAYQEIPQKFLWLTQEPALADQYLRDPNLVELRLQALSRNPMGVYAVPLPFLWVGATITNESHFIERASFASQLPSSVRVLYLKRMKRFPVTLATWLSEQRTIDWILYEGRRYGNSQLGWDIFGHCERIGIPFYGLRMSALTHWNPQAITGLEGIENFDSWDAETWPERLPRQFPNSAFL